MTLKKIELHENEQYILEFFRKLSDEKKLSFLELIEQLDDILTEKGTI